MSSCPKLGVSACLTGQKCRYDGKVRPAQFAEDQVVAVCPEVLGGLAVPRVPCEIAGGDGQDVLSGRAKVIGADGKDYTSAYVRGAYAAADRLKAAGVTRVVLKEKSPSCGVRQIYHHGRLVNGCGVFAALLTAYGIMIIAEGEKKNE